MARSRIAREVKHEPAFYKRDGKLVQKFGIKILGHNHTLNFNPVRELN
jgi:hypothetical protein